MAYTPVSPSSKIIDQNGNLLTYIIPGVTSASISINMEEQKVEPYDEVKYYTIFYRKSSSTVAETRDVTPADLSAAGWKWPIFRGYLDNMSRGESLIVSVKVITEKAQSGWDNQASPLRAINEPIVNSLPTISSISVNSSMFYGGKGTQTFSLSGSTNDSGQTLSYWYSDSPSGIKKKFNNGSFLEFEYGNDYDAGDYPDYKTFYTYFWAYDGYEYSSNYKSQETIVFSKVNITNPSEPSLETVSSLDGTSFLTKYKFTADINKSTTDFLADVSGYIVPYMSEITEPITIKSSDYSYSIANRKITFEVNFSNIGSYIPDNWFDSKNIGKLKSSLNALIVNFEVRGTDRASEDIDNIDTRLSIYSYPRIFKDFPSSFSNNKYAKGIIKGKEYFDKYYDEITLESSNLDILKSYSKSIVLKRGTSLNENSYSYTIVGNSQIEDDSLNATKDAEGTYLKYQVIVTDPYGKKTKTYNFSNTLRKMISPRIENISYTGTLEPYKPLSSSFEGSNNLILQILERDFYLNGKMLSTYTDNEIKESVKKWVWDIRLNNSNKASSTFVPITTHNDDLMSVQLNIPNKTLLNEMKTFYNANQQDGTYILRLRISVTDEYGLSSNILYTSNFLNIDFRESPIFSGNLQIKHILLTWDDNNEPINTKWESISPVENGSADQKVNSNEWIKIIGPSVTDENIRAGADSREHLIYILTRTNIDNGITETILRRSGYASIFEYVFKSSNYYSNIIKYKYTLKVEDRYGLSNQCTSGFKTDYDLIACPTNSLNDLSNMISFTSTKKEGDNNTYNIATSIDFKNDLFGYNNYSDYKNAERGEYTPFFNIYLYYATDINTLNSYKTNPSNSDNRKTIKTFNSSDSLFTTVTSETFSFPIETTTYFMVSTEFSTGLKKDGNPNYIYSFSKTYVVDPSAPTVAIRKNYLGINTNEADLTNDTLLKVKVLESNSEKVKIYLTGAQSTGSGTEIIIDLSDGSIDGAIINGGTW